MDEKNLNCVSKNLRALRKYLECVKKIKIGGGNVYQKYNLKILITNDVFEVYLELNQILD